MKRAAVKLILALTILAGGLSLLAPSEATAGSCKVQKGAICPTIFAPVLCSTRNNKVAVFSNQCIADAECATSCLPL